MKAQCTCKSPPGSALFCQPGTLTVGCESKWVIHGALRMGCLQMGQVLFSESHRSMQWMWNSWEQGRRRSLLPWAYSLMQTLQARPSSPSRLAWPYVRVDRLSICSFVRPLGCSSSSSSLSRKKWASRSIGRVPFSTRLLVSRLVARPSVVLTIPPPSLACTPGSTSFPTSPALSWSAAPATTWPPVLSLTFRRETGPVLLFASMWSTWLGATLSESASVSIRELSSPNPVMIWRKMERKAVELGSPRPVSLMRLSGIRMVLT